MKKAIFLDRDGTINEDRGYIFKKKDLIFIKGAIKGLLLLQKFYNLYIITNQSGINKGFFTEKQYKEFNKYFLQKLKTKGVKIKKIFYCKHTDNDKCICKKPSTYFIKVIKSKENIDLKNSFTIGDHPHDIEMGKKAGTRTIYLLSGHGKKHFKELKQKPDYITKNLLKAAEYIINKENNYAKI